MDAKLFGCLDVTLDLWKEHRTNIWVTSEGKYSEIFGMEPPYENAGIVDSKGIEVGLDYSKKLGQVEFNVGGNFSLNKNEIKEMLEEPRQYANLVQTGNPYGQLLQCRSQHQEHVLAVDKQHQYLAICLRQSLDTTESECQVPASEQPKQCQQLPDIYSVVGRPLIYQVAQSGSVLQVARFLAEKDENCKRR